MIWTPAYHNKKSNLKWLFILLFWCTSWASSAQRYPFYNLNVENGLIQSQSRTLAQDKYGHLWIGTLGGLSRYDGVDFANYSVRHGLLDNEVKSIATDSNGDIWIGCRKGLSMYNGKSFTHFRFESTEQNVDNNVNQIAIGQNSTVWCVTNGKVYEVIKNNTHQIKFSKKITTIFPDTSGLWLADDAGVLYHKKKQGLDSIKLQLHVGTNTISVTKIFRNKQGQLLLATTRGLYILKDSIAFPFTVKGFPLDKIPPILALSEDKYGAIWAGLTSGVLRITDTTINYFNKKNGLCDNAIVDIITDAEGNVWFASDGQGVYRFSGAQFTILDESSGLPSAQVMSIEADPNGKLYLGTYDAGFYTYQNGKITKQALPFPTSSAINAIKFYQGHVWLGIGGNGLVRFNGSSFVVYNKKNQVPSTLITSLHAAPDGKLWIGTIDGAAYYEQDSFHTVLPKGAVEGFAHLGGDTILMATTKGLKIYHDGIVKPFITGSAPDSATLQCITVHDRDVWIGSSDNGLICYNLTTKKCFVLNKSSGMQSDFVYNVIVDNSGNIWAGTGYGIHKISLQQNQKPRITVYGKGQGIYGMESNHNAVLKMSDGSLWFGTTNGAVHYRPLSKQVVPFANSIVVQNIKLFGENINNNTYYDSTDNWYNVPYGLHLPHQKNNLSFTFKAISLANANVLYRYRMDGLDAPWSDWSTTNSVTFSALPPGKYIFIVECNAGGTTLSKRLQYPFEIITPFHKTYWFKWLIIIACIMLGVTVQYIINQRKQNRLKLVEQLRKEEQSKVRQRTAEDFHDEVGNRLTRINILTNVLKKKVGIATPEADRIITQIQDNAAQLYGGTRDILWSLKPTNDNLYEIIHRIRDFGTELFMDTDIHFVFEGTDERWRNYKLPIDQSRNLIMIFKEALNNCLKYAHAKTVFLKVVLKEDDIMQLQLSDDGKGFDLHYVKRGHGIDNMNVRAKRIDGRLYIDAQEMKGTTIHLTFKLRKEYRQKGDA